MSKDEYTDEDAVGDDDDDDDVELANCCWLFSIFCIGLSVFFDFLFAKFIDELLRFNPVLLLLVVVGVVAGVLVILVVLEMIWDGWICEIGDDAHYDWAGDNGNICWLFWICCW